MTKEPDELALLKNLGATSVNILHAIGIYTYDELEKIGSVEAYLRIKQRGINVSRTMLYALQGALLHTHWTELPPDIKQQLLEEAGEAIT